MPRASSRRLVLPLYSLWPVPSSTVIHRCAVLLERPDIFAAIFAAEEAAKLGLQQSKSDGVTLAERMVRGGKDGSHAERRRGGDLLRNLGGTIELLPRRRQLLDEPQPVRLIGIPAVARQHVAHGVGPARLAHEPDRGAAAWK